MRAVLDLVEQVAPRKVPVLIEGASGTGKELIAREIHNRSPVHEKPFMAINCIALPDSLLESELFGYKKGAFTGALKDSIGLFEQVAGGTVFLDEVASMSPSFQGKLLRVLQEKTVRPLGGNEERMVEFRVIAASNSNLGELVKSGGFREDLYYRLQVMKISLPTLRERKSCIPALAGHFLKRAAADLFYDEHPCPEISPAALDALINHNWPGNVRELENTIQRALIICKGDKILPSHLGISDVSEVAESLFGQELTSYEEGKQQAIAAFQRQYVQVVLERTDGNISRAAEMCGLTRAALQRILRKLRLERAGAAH
jgi:transcriptional regulator with PAS, ATPase and Fis domain